MKKWGQIAFLGLSQKIEGRSIDLIDCSACFCAVNSSSLVTVVSTLWYAM